MTAYDYPMSRAILDARVAVANPSGRSAAELAGHVVLLQLSGEHRDERLAQDFLRDYGHTDIGLHLAPQIGEPINVRAPEVSAPVEIPWDQYRRTGLIRSQVLPCLGLMAGTQTNSPKPPPNLTTPPASWRRWIRTRSASWWRRSKKTLD